ncbi:MAG: hypothetical protein AAFQ95_14235 [Cyanobacteria bacterium J06621_3]
MSSYGCLYQIEQRTTADITLDVLGTESVPKIRYDYYVDVPGDMNAVKHSKKLLILAANPNGSSERRLDAEVREIKEGLKLAKNRDLFVVEQRWSVRPRDVQRAMLEVKPQIVHFSGQGDDTQGVILEDNQGDPVLVGDAALGSLFELFAEQVKCVVLNGCYTEAQAAAIAQHIPHVIGTTIQQQNEKVSDGAIAFAVGFYDALGAGESVDFAYKLGCNAMALEGVTTQLIPAIQKGPDPEASAFTDDVARQLPKYVRSTEVSVTEASVEDSRDGSAVVAVDSANESLTESDDIYQTLLRLGYQKQSRLFRRVIEADSIAALLICGAPNYGQRWLLNRLVLQYVPHLITGKVIKVNVGRRVRRNDLSALWREVAGRVGLRGKPYTPSDIIKEVSHCLETQDVILIFNEIDAITEAALSEIVEEFWLPLTKSLKAADQLSEFKLLLFLVDYDGCVGGWKFPFADKITSKWTAEVLVKSPELTKFSEDDLMSWMEDEYQNLPELLTASGIDDVVESVLADSEEGVPEHALEIICDRCDCDWYEESEKWLKL